MLPEKTKAPAGTRAFSEDNRGAASALILPEHVFDRACSPLCRTARTSTRRSCKCRCKGRSHASTTPTLPGAPILCTPLSPSTGSTSTMSLAGGEAA